MSDAYPFSCDTWVSADKLPDVPLVLRSASALLDSSASWKPHKKFHRGLVSTLSRRDRAPAGGGQRAPAWHVRVSEHSKAGDGQGGEGFADLWWALGVDHSLHEQEYVPELKRATLLRTFEPGRAEAWALYYTFPPPISPRTFTVLVLISPPSSAPSGPADAQEAQEALIVSLPYTPSPEEEKLLKKSVRGKYCSIERIRQLGNGKTEWRMAVQSTTMGAIPGWVQELGVPGKISDDVPFVQKWLKTHPTPPTSAPSAHAAAPEPTSAAAVAAPPPDTAAAPTEPANGKSGPPLLE